MNYDNQQELSEPFRLSITYANYNYLSLNSISMLFDNYWRNASIKFIRFVNT